MDNGHVPRKLELEHSIKDVEGYLGIEVAEADADQDTHDGDGEDDVAGGTAPVNVGAHPHGGQHGAHATKEASHEERPQQPDAAAALTTAAHVATPTAASACGGSSTTARMSRASTSLLLPGSIAMAAWG